jgi:hypothetical protein
MIDRTMWNARASKTKTVLILDPILVLGKAVMQDTPLHPSHLHVHASSQPRYEHPLSCRATATTTLPLQTTCNTRHAVPRMKEYTKARRRAAENSTLLFCLNEHPAAPREITYAPSTSSSDLSIRREMQLAEDFAFISSMEDDPNGVTAVCIESDHKTAGFTLRVAINTGCPSHIVEQLQVVADIMVRASKHGMSEFLSQIDGSHAVH